MRNRNAELGTYFLGNEMREIKRLSKVCSRDKFGKAGFGAEPAHPPESGITPTPSRYNAVTIVGVYELLLASCAKLLAKFRAKHRKERTVQIK